MSLKSAVLTGAIAAANALSNEVTDAVAETSVGKRYVVGSLGRGPISEYVHYVVCL